MSEVISPIPTMYQGYAFRSRLEARWAVFLDQLELEWVYELEGYDLGPLGYYLPDFRVTTRTQSNSDGSARRGRRIWVEIKADAPSEQELNKLRALAEGTGLEAHLIFGDPLRASIFNVRPKIDGQGDEAAPALWLGLESLAHVFECNFTRTISAANAARQARFEHGESGAPIGTWK